MKILIYAFHSQKVWVWRISNYIFYVENSKSKILRSQYFVLKRRYTWRWSRFQRIFFSNKKMNSRLLISIRVEFVQEEISNAFSEDDFNHATRIFWEQIKKRVLIFFLFVLLLVEFPRSLEKGGLPPENKIYLSKERHHCHWLKIPRPIVSKQSQKKNEIRSTCDSSFTGVSRLSPLKQVRIWADVICGSDIRDLCFSQWIKTHGYNNSLTLRVYSKNMDNYQV